MKHLRGSAPEAEKRRRRPRPRFFQATTGVSIDVALRRRFMLIDCPPDAGILQRYYLSGRENQVDNLVEGFKALNQELTRLSDEHHTIGHAFFMADGFNRRALERAWRHKIGPLIQEYFFDQPETARSFTVDRFWAPADE